MKITNKLEGICEITSDNLANKVINAYLVYKPYEDISLKILTSEIIGQLNESFVPQIEGFIHLKGHRKSFILNHGLIVSIGNISRGAFYIIRFSFLLIAHLQNDRSLNFTSIKVQFNHLTSWLNGESIYTKSREENINLTFGSHVLDTEKYEIEKYGEIKFRKEVVRPPTEVKRQIVIKEESFALVNTPTKSLPEIIDQIVEPLRAFLVISCGKNILPSELFLSNESNSYSSFYLPRRYNKRSYANQKNHLDFAFHFNEENFPRVFKKWISRYDDFSDFLQVILDYIVKDFEFTPNHYMNIIQTLEGYHRTVTEIDPDTSNAHLELLENMKSALEDAGVSTEYIGKLEYAHEPSLAKRLIQIYDNEWEIFKDTLGPKRRNMKNWCRTSARLRNEIAHVLDVNEPKEYDGLNLYRRAKILEAGFFISLYTNLESDYQSKVAIKEIILKQ